MQRKMPAEYCFLCWALLIAETEILAAADVQVFTPRDNRRGSNLTRKREKKKTALFWKRETWHTTATLHSLAVYGYISRLKNNQPLA